MSIGAGVHPMENVQRGRASPRRVAWRTTSFLAGGAIGNGVTITPAVHAVFGTFLIPVTAEFGWPRATFSVVLMIISASAAVIYPLSGRVADRFGARLVLVTGYLLFAVALAGLSFLDGSVPLLYFGFLLVGICGAIPSTALLSKVVSERFRGQATPLALTAGMGNAVGCMVMPVVAAAVMRASGWRDAYWTISAIVLVLGTISVVLLGNGRPDRAQTERSARTDGAPAMRFGLTFWLLVLTIGFGAGGTTVIFSHIVPILAERGIGLEEATAAVSLFALVSLIAQILSGRLLDIFQSPRIAVGFYLAGGPGLALIEFGHGYLAIVTGIGLLGIASGMQFAALPYFVGRYFGFQHFGLIVGLMYSGVVTAQGVLPVMLDATFDVSGSYRGAIVVACLAYAVGAALLCLLPPYSQRGADGDAAE